MAHQVLTGTATKVQSPPPSCEAVGGPTRPKKGKPLSKGKLVQLMKDTRGWNIVVAGPDFVGVSTLLRELELRGYHVLLQHHKPSASKRLEFQQHYFDHLVTTWQSACDDPRALLIEDSPWAYLCRHALHVLPSTRE
jgi:hypothetical protein